MIAFLYYIVLQLLSHILDRLPQIDFLENFNGYLGYITKMFLSKGPGEI